MEITRMECCIDRNLYSAPDPQGALAAAPQRLALEKRKKWPEGSIITVAFLDGTETQQREAWEAAQTWMQHAARIELQHTGHKNADIRISFAGSGAWSYVGTDCLSVPNNQPTMNLGFNQPGTYLHEWGHAFGGIHEHSNPKGGIQWNREQVYKDLSGPPNYWSREQIDRNMFSKYSVDQLNATDFDPNSIMLYSFPATWTVGGVATKRNTELSESDIALFKHVYGEIEKPQPEMWRTVLNNQEMRIQVKP